MDISEIKQIVKLMEAKGLTEFTFKDDNREFCLKRGNGDHQLVYATPQPQPISQSPSLSETKEEVKSTNVKKEKNEGLIEIPSPIVGTFYRKPAPDKPNYVSEGDIVGSDSVVCIVEAMKVMNEIKAEVSGIVSKILVEDGSPVQFGQPLFLVKPA